MIKKQISTIEDLAIMRALPNMTVVAPGDAKEAEALALASVSFPGPLYIRFGRDIDPVAHEGNFQFKIGQGIVVKQGKDNNICIMATGTMLYPGKLVSEILEKQVRTYYLLEGMINLIGSKTMPNTLFMNNRSVSLKLKPILKDV